jgi:hypothetical protein
VSGNAQMADHAIHSLRRSAGGDISLERRGAGGLRIEPMTGGWRIAEDGILDGWMLVRGEEPSTSFLLLHADGETEAGRTISLPGGGRQADLQYLLTSDGCLYRIKLRGPRDGRYELQGWESPGAYLTARPVDVGWTISPEPAASGILEIRTLLILFAAVILDSEEPMAAG